MIHSDKITSITFVPRSTSLLAYIGGGDCDSGGSSSSEDLNFKDFLIIASLDSTITVFDLDGLRVVKTFTQHRQGVDHCKYSFSQKHVVSCAGKAILVWSAHSLEVLAKLKPLPSLCCSLEIIELTPDQQLKNSDIDKSADTATAGDSRRQQQHSLVASILSKNSSSFSDERIVAVTQERSMYVWDNFSYGFLYSLPPAPTHHSASAYHYHSQQEQQALNENAFHCALYVPELEKLFAADQRISAFDYVRYTCVCVYVYVCVFVSFFLHATLLASRRFSRPMVSSRVSHYD